MHLLREMPKAKKLELTAAAIAAGLALSQKNRTTMNPFDIAALVTHYLEERQIDYFLGGSVASTLHGEPRFTQDVNIIVRLSAAEIKPLVARFSGEFYVSETAMEEAVAGKGCANLIHLASNFKVDLMVSREREFERARFQRRERLTAGDHQFWVATAEDIVLVKLEWFRAGGEVSDRQWRDIRTVLLVQQNLDHQYLTHWARQLGVEDLLRKALQENS